jgi:retinol dehydrogenase-14
MSEWSIEGKTCLVTGATGGVGYATAMGLAKSGAHVVLLCRDEQKGRDAVSGIAKMPDDQPELLICDLMSLDSIDKAAERFMVDHDKLHVLVNNAAAYLAKRDVTVDGYERTFQTNHLGPFYLTALLTQMLQYSAPARVINLTSFNHRFGTVDFEDLHRERRPYSAMGAYNDTKLMNVLFTRELAKRLEGTGVTANAVHPGVVATDFGGDEPSWVGTLFPLIRWFVRTPEQGADTVVHLATDPWLQKKSGRYWYSRMDREPAPKAQDATVQRKLWAVSAGLVGLDETYSGR